MEPRFRHEHFFVDFFLFFFFSFLILVAVGDAGDERKREGGYFNAEMMMYYQFITG